MPYFGKMRMRDILPEHIREWITWMQDKGVQPATIQKCKRAILNGIFTHADSFTWANLDSRPWRSVATSSSS